MDRSDLGSGSHGCRYKTWLPYCSRFCPGRLAVHARPGLIGRSGSHDSQRECSQNRRRSSGGRFERLSGFGQCLWWLADCDQSSLGRLGFHDLGVLLHGRWCSRELPSPLSRKISLSECGHWWILGSVLSALCALEKAISGRDDQVLEFQTLAIKRSIVKDWGLPIKLFDAPYWDYFLDLYRQHFGLGSILDSVREAIDAAGGEDEFLQCRKDLAQEILSAIKALPSYLEWERSSPPQPRKREISVSKRSIFRIANDGQHFLGIDLVAANFHAIRRSAPELVFGSESYKDLLARFTDVDYFHRCKPLRQFIFGNLNPKKQQSIQRGTITAILESLKDLFEPEQFVNASSDEVIILISKEFDSEPVQERLRDLSQPLRFEQYQLRSLAGTDCFVREFRDGSVDFKNVPGHFFPQAFKYYHGLEINEMDRTFLFEGQQAVFRYPLFP